MLFFVPRLTEKITLKPALLKREPEWWIGSELSAQGYTRQHCEPILETFLFWLYCMLIKSVLIKEIKQLTTCQSVAYLHFSAARSNCHPDFV